MGGERVSGRKGLALPDHVEKGGAGTVMQAWTDVGEAVKVENGGQESIGLELTPQDGPTASKGEVRWGVVLLSKT